MSTEDLHEFTNGNAPERDEGRERALPESQTLWRAVPVSPEGRVLRDLRAAEARLQVAEASAREANRRAELFEARAKALDQQCRELDDAIVNLRRELLRVAGDFEAVTSTRLWRWGGKLAAMRAGLLRLLRLRS